MNSVSLNNLWNYLQGLSLSASNQRWLGERLIEASKGATTVPAESLRHHVRKHRTRLSDEELAEKLAQYEPLTDADFPEVCVEDYANFAKYHTICNSHSAHVQCGGCHCPL